MKRHGKKHRSTRQQCRILFWLDVIVLPLGIAALLLPLCYPFTPTQAIHDYELDELYGPSEVLAEVAAAPLPEADPPEDLAEDAAHLFLCRYETCRSLISVTEAPFFFSWSASGLMVLEVPDEVPVALSLEALEDQMLFGVVRDERVARIVVTGSSSPAAHQGPAAPVTVEIPQLYDRAFAAALEGDALTDAPMTICGYDKHGTLCFTTVYSAQAEPSFSHME